MAEYKVLVGVNYPGKGGKEVRREPGEVVGDIPLAVVPGWLEQRIIEKAEKAPVKEAAE